MTNKRSVARKERCGDGTGSSYSAYIQVRRGDFSSAGRSHIIPSPLFEQRSHHALSDLERNSFLALLTKRPSDIREQYRLALLSNDDETVEGTIEIAERLGVEHPPHQSFRRHMTTDFFVEYRHRLPIAVHCKYVRELETKRNKQLRSIEREYWKQRGVRLVTMTEESVPRRYALNLYWAFSAMTSDGDQVGNKEVPMGWIEDVALLNAQRFCMRTALEQLVDRYDAAVSQQVVWLKLAVMMGLIDVRRAVHSLDLTRPWNFRPARDGYTYILV